MKGKEKYPWTVYTYDQFLQRAKPDIAVSMDYNTSIVYEKSREQYRKVKIDLFTKTINNFAEQFDMKRDYELMIAVQGVPLEDKILFLEMLDEVVPLKKVEWFGYGGRVDVSLCNSLTTYLERIDKNFKFHMLGATFSQIENMLKSGISFHSFDTITWIREIQFGRTFDDSGKPVLLKNTSQSTVEAQRRILFQHYHKVLETLKMYDENEKPLF
jgi:hypothetical protein